MFPRPSLPRSRRPVIAVVGALSVCASVSLCACAGTGKDDGISGDDTGGGGGGGGGSGANAAMGTFGAPVEGDAGGDDAKAPRAQRCDANGRCTCFNIASIGQPGHTGFGNGSDGTTAFTEWLNTQSSANVDLVTARPTLDAAFLGKYDVVILQWLVDGISGSNGSGYWTFGADEIRALKT